jgi:hypothetical protein
VVINDATTTEKGKIMLAGDLAGTAAAPTVPALTGKVNKGANTEYELLSDSSDVYAPALFSRVGSIFRSSFIKWFETLKVFSVEGSQCQIEPNANVTDGNMIIKGVINASEALKLMIGAITVASFGNSNGSPVFRFYTPLRYISDSTINEVHFIASTIETSGTLNIKQIAVPNNSIITVDLLNIATMNVDGNYITGNAQFAFRNTAGVITAIGDIAQNYARQYSSLTAGAPTGSDTRLQVAISGTNLIVQFVNTVNKLTNVNCRIEYNIVNQPIAE